MKENILIIGAGIAGISLVNDIKSNHKDLQIIGILDDNQDKVSSTNLETEFLGKIDTLPDVLMKYKINRIIICIPSEKGNLIRKIVLGIGEYEDIDIFILPRESEILSKIEVTLDDVRPIDSVDIIGEQIVKEDLVKVSNVFSEEVVLVTGGGGSIGSELCKQIYLLKPKKLIILEMCEKNLFWVDLIIKNLKNQKISTEVQLVLGNTNNTFLLKNIFENNKITSIFHAAAYKHVPLLETNIYEAILNNSISTYNLSKFAIEYKVKKFILVSTDKAVNPINNMGMSKRLSEKIITYFNNNSGDTLFSAVRFGNVFNSSGSAVEVFLHQIAKEKRITITDPLMTRYFMSIPEAVHLILQAWFISQKDFFYMLEMGDAINILELAKCLVRINGFKISTFNFEIIGERPGEKTHEELFNKEIEERKSTVHNRIYKISNKPISEGFEIKLDKLLSLSQTPECISHSQEGEKEMKIAMRKLIDFI